MILFFYGPNTYAARQQISKLITQYQEKSGSDFGLERIDGSTVTAEILRAALLAAPFLANSRLAIIEGLGSNKTVAGGVEDLIADVPETTVAVFYDPEVDQRTSYFKTLSKRAQTVKFEALSVPKLQQWIVRIAREAGAEIERPAISRLLELAGEDQWRLSHEVAKLAAYRSPITVETVAVLVEEVHTETVFSLVEAMTAGKPEVALPLYRQLRSNGQNEMYLLTMTIWQLRNLLLAKTAGRMSAGELAKAAGMSPYVAGKMLSKRHLFHEGALKSAFVAAIDTDYQIKSGVGRADVLVEQLIYRLAGKITD